MTASGTSVLPIALDPTAEGLTLSFFGGAGTVLLTTFVPPEAVHASGATAFTLARDYRDGALRMLNLRVRQDVTRVRARLPADPATVAGPLGWAFASGQSCGRSAPLPCSVSPRGLNCR